MAIERTPEQLAELFTSLCAPFSLKELQWRVISKTPDKNKGIVAPYADPRAYHNRLNKVLTPAGWSCTYGLNTLNGITRAKGSSNIATGKITAIATVELFGISIKSSMGEMWADDENAVTRAEAQAFKRACSMFGLGKYLYDLKDALGSKLWVPLDGKGYPASFPQLPAWALPAAAGQQQSTQSARQQASQPATQQVKPAANQQQALPVDTSAVKARFDGERKQFEATLGQPLFANLLSHISKMEEEGKLPEKQSRYSVAYRKMSECVKTLEAINSIASDMPSGALDAILDRLDIKRLDLIPTHKAFHMLAVELGVLKTQQAKAA